MSAVVIRKLSLSGNAVLKVLYFSEKVNVPWGCCSCHPHKGKLCASARLQTPNLNTRPLRGVKFECHEKEGKAESRTREFILKQQNCFGRKSWGMLIYGQTRETTFESRKSKSICIKTLQNYRTSSESALSLGTSPVSSVSELISYVLQLLLRKRNLDHEKRLRVIVLSGSKKISSR